MDRTPGLRPSSIDEQIEEERINPSTYWRATLASALRSGDYKPNPRGLYLKQRIGEHIYHCPWGVACEIFSRYIDGEWREDSSGIFHFKLDRANVLCYPPFRVTRFFHIGNFDYKGDRIGIIHAHDKLKLPFSEIADLIETLP